MFLMEGDILRSNRIKKLSIYFIVTFIIVGGYVMLFCEYRMLKRPINQNCIEYISNAKTSFSSFIEKGNQVHYISGAENIHTFLAYYEISDYYQADNFIAMTQAHTTILFSSSEMTVDRIEQLVEALSILEKDINSAAGYSALDIFINYDSYY